MNATVPTMGPNTDFKHWKRNLITFLSLKAANLIPPLAIWESSVWPYEIALNYTHALLLHATIGNKRVNQAVKCIFVARLDYATTAWDILCEGVDGRSFAHSLSLLDKLMLLVPRQLVAH
jgi:hypothetical protein